MNEHVLALIADGHISPYLIKTLAKHRIPVLAQNKKVIEKISGYGEDITFLSEEEGIELLLNYNDLIYTNAEETLPVLLKNSIDQSLINNIRLFKDKSKMRLFLKNIYPDFYFLEVKKEELKYINIVSGMTFIIKPAVGFLSIGIRKIKTSKDIDEKINEIFSEIKKYSKTFPPSVINPDRFLIEEYLTGAEFACDAYFNSIGEPVILGIYSHPFLNEDDFRDVVYYTNSKIMYEMLPKIENFLRTLSSLQKISNFPVHIEFRWHKNNLIPIELNPMRFGGFGLADLPNFAFGINSYEHYFFGKKPDWNKILASSGDENFYFVLGRMPERLSAGRKPDHEKFKDTFRDLIDYYELDYIRYPAFAIAFGRTDNINEALKYLSYDFNEYFY